MINAKQFKDIWYLKEFLKETKLKSDSIKHIVLIYED
jgi:hypothetical protein